MDVTHQTDDEQAALWNGRAGRAWVEAQDVLDQMFKPFEDLLVDAISRRLRQAGCSTSAAARAARRSPSRGGSERRAAVSASTFRSR